MTPALSLLAGDGATQAAVVAGAGAAVLTALLLRVLLRPASARAGGDVVAVSLAATAALAAAVVCGAIGHPLDAFFSGGLLAPALLLAAGLAIGDALGSGAPRTPSEATAQSWRWFAMPVPNARIPRRGSAAAWEPWLLAGAVFLTPLGGLALQSAHAGGQPWGGAIGLTAVAIWIAGVTGAATRMRSRRRQALRTGAVPAASAPVWRARPARLTAVAAGALVTAFGLYWTWTAETHAASLAGAAVTAAGYVTLASAQARTRGMDDQPSSLWSCWLPWWIGAVVAQWPLWGAASETAAAGHAIGALAVAAAAAARGPAVSWASLGLAAGWCAAGSAGPAFGAVAMPWCALAVALYGSPWHVPSGGGWLAAVTPGIPLLLVASGASIAGVDQLGWLHLVYAASPLVATALLLAGGTPGRLARSLAVFGGVLWAFAGWPLVSGAQPIAALVAGIAPAGVVCLAALTGAPRRTRRVRTAAVGGVA